MSGFDISHLSPALVSISESVQCRDPAQTEFHQAVYEVPLTITPLAERRPGYANLATIDCIVESERQIQFHVSWADDKGNTHVNRGFRVEYNSALGPYKGGLRFHPFVNLSTIKFLGFEQIFKNAPTGLPMGGGRGGVGFNPKGKSDAKIMYSCQSLMTELSRHIGPDTDVSASDIGMGGREIGYMSGQYKCLKNRFDAGALTGKDLLQGGSYVRTEATGYGLVYFTAEVLVAEDTSFGGKRVVVSGSGSVVIYATGEAQQLGVTVVAVPDSSGYVVDEAGIGVVLLKDIKEVCCGCVSDYAAERPGAVFVADGSI